MQLGRQRAFRHLLLFYPHRTCGLSELLSAGPAPVFENARKNALAHTVSSLTQTQLSMQSITKLEIL